MPTFPCKRCGRPLTRRRATATRPRHIQCPRCRFLLYDYPRPACGVVVVRGDDTLVLRRAHLPRIGALDIPGGFLEAGEALEAAARRELFEETGLRVGPMMFLGTYWDAYVLPGFGRFPTLNFYWVGTWRRGTPVASDDAASAEWRNLAELAGARGALRRAFAWPHMQKVFRDARRQVQASASRPARSSRSVSPRPAGQRCR